MPGSGKSQKPAKRVKSPEDPNTVIRVLRKQLMEARRAIRGATLDLEFALELERRRSQELEEAYYDTILRLSRASAYKDRETGAHIQRVSHYSRILARELGWSEADQELIFRAAPMHDVGKIAIPDLILAKRGSLDKEDRRQMEAHTLIGASLLEGSSSRLMDMAREIALTHHEHWDGSGYPHGLSGEQIPIAGRIVTVADRYDALRSRRSYKTAFDHPSTVRLILEGDSRIRPEHLDPQLLAIFREAHLLFDEIFEQYKDE